MVAYIPPPPSLLLYEGVGEVEFPKELRSPVRWGLLLNRKALERELCREKYQYYNRFFGFSKCQLT